MKRAHDFGEMAEGSAFCRAFGHNWAQVSHEAYGGKGRKPGWAVTLECPTCGTRKHFMLSQRGELTAPRYEYPDNYLAAFYIGAEERGQFRLEALGLHDNPLRVINGGKE